MFAVFWMLALASGPSLGCFSSRASQECSADDDCLRDEFCSEALMCTQRECMRSEDLRCRQVCDLFGVSCDAVETKLPEREGFVARKFVVSGDVMAAQGMDGEDPVVLVFEREGGAWSERVRLPLPTSFDAFGQAGRVQPEYELALDSDTLVVSTYGSLGGMFRIFERRSSAWVLTESSPWILEPRFGEALELDGRTLFASSPGALDMPSGVRVCTVHVFEQRGTTWSRVASISVDEADDGGRGQRLAQDQDTLLVQCSGRIHVAEKGDAGWQESAGMSLPWFADSFDVDGDTIVMQDSSRTQESVRVLRRGEAGWEESALLEASNDDPGDCFGCALALDGDTLVVGAPGEDSDSSGVNGEQFSGALPESGAIYVFERLQEEWSQVAYIKASSPMASERFGSDIAVFGSEAMVGSSPLEAEDDDEANEISSLRVVRIGR